jgi:hypothetical protein
MRDNYPAARQRVVDPSIDIGTQSNGCSELSGCGDSPCVCAVPFSPLTTYQRESSTGEETVTPTNSSCGDRRNALGHQDVISCSSTTTSYRGRCTSKFPGRKNPAQRRQCKLLSHSRVTTPWRQEPLAPRTLPPELSAWRESMHRRALRVRAAPPGHRGRLRWRGSVSTIRGGRQRPAPAPKRSQWLRELARRCPRGLHLQPGACRPGPCTRRQSMRGQQPTLWRNGKP